MVAGGVVPAAFALCAACLPPSPRSLPAAPAPHSHAAVCVHVLPSLALRVAWFDFVPGRRDRTHGSNAGTHRGSFLCAPSCCLRPLLPVPRRQRYRLYAYRPPVQLVQRWQQFLRRCAASSEQLASRTNAGPGQQQRLFAGSSLLLGATSRFRPWRGHRSAMRGPRSANWHAHELLFCAAVAWRFEAHWRCRRHRACGCDQLGARGHGRCARQRSWRPRWYGCRRGHLLVCAAWCDV